MGYSLSDFSDRQRAMMEPETRKALGPLASTVAEARAKADAMAEKEMHKTFEQWLRLNHIALIHSRMDRKPTIAEGWPDFTLLKNNRCLLIEFKAGRNTLSKEQRECIDKLSRESGVTTLVCYSVAEAIEQTRSLLCDGG